VAVYLWAVLHDRATDWACDADNWPEGLWRGKLPSQSIMSRRLQTTEVQRVLARMEQRLAALDRGGFVMLVDGKPLLVGSHSKDPDAAWGHVRRGWAKGYKLHVVYGSGCLPLGWEVTPLNEAEVDVAARLISPIKRGGGYILGDSSYDSNPLHDVALAVGCQLVARRKRPRASLGHRRHSPGRLRSIALLQQQFGHALYAFREHVEQQFAWLTNHGAGLAPLPNWVRRWPRVRQWIQAKLLVHVTYIALTSNHPSLAVA
jgi:Transposase DDE domain